jgi:hypothetical protein
MSKRVKLRKQMFEHVRCWKSSGLSQREYCEKARISRTQFYYWMKIHKESFVEHKQEVSFLPVVVKESAPEDAGQQIVVRCPNGLDITFPAMTWSIGLIRQLITG